MTNKTVAIIGGGVAGLSAALELARFGIRADVIESADACGGHAIQLTCKATDRCVKCGACIVQEKLARASTTAGIRLLTGCRIEEISTADGFEIKLRQKKVAPDAGTARLVLKADAVIWAAGFSLFNPQNKPYGYGLFKNVITNLDLEGIVRREGLAARPSDGKTARSVAFIQCVGSRDIKHNHLWCSKFCCASALRMANLILTREPQTNISFFYIDVQTFGRDFETVYRTLSEDIRMIRAIPGDIFQRGDGSLTVTYLDDKTHESVEEVFELVVLSAGMQPRSGNLELIRQLNLERQDDGFVQTSSAEGEVFKAGVFVAGAAGGPAGIAESIASAGQAALHTLKYLRAEK